MALSTWRRQISHHPLMERAYALRALSKVVGSVQQDKRNPYHVKFATRRLSATIPHQRTIIIDPTYASRGTPIPPEDFDILCGLAAHEGSHILTRSSDLTLNYEAVEEGRVCVESIAAIGEEIYADGKVYRDFPILGQYLRKARDAYRSATEAHMDWNNVLKAWAAVALYQMPIPQGLPDDILRALGVLLRESQRLSKEELQPYQRDSIYRALANELASLNVRWAISLRPRRKRRQRGIDPSHTEAVEEAVKKLMGEPDTAQQETPADEEPSGEPKTLGSANPILPTHNPAQIDESMMAAIDRLIQSEAEDLTEALASYLEPQETCDLPTVIWERSQTKPTTADPNLCRDLEWLKQLKLTIGRVTYRRELEGQLDGRELWRAPVDGRSFMVRRKLPRRERKVILVLDASGSMISRTLVYHCAAAVAKVLGSLCEVLSYKFDGGYVQLQTHKLHNQPMTEVKPGGTTPSGIALLAAAHKYKEGLVIHFTDGQSNVGPTPVTIFPILGRKFPNLRLVDIRYRGYRSLVDFPNVRTVYLDNIHDFPATLREALRPWASSIF